MLTLKEAHSSRPTMIKGSKELEHCGYLEEERFAGGVSNYYLRAVVYAEDALGSDQDGRSTGLVDLQSFHRVREHLFTRRLSIINQICGLSLQVEPSWFIPQLILFRQYPSPGRCKHELCISSSLAVDSDTDPVKPQCF